MTPYSALAGGGFLPDAPAKPPLREDSYAKLKYDAAAEQDGVIIDRVAALADKRGVSMTEISLAWLLTRAAAPVVGATKVRHIEGGGKAVFALTADERAYLEELYVPHKLVGVMAQNTPAAAKGRSICGRPAVKASERRTEKWICIKQTPNLQSALRILHFRRL